MPNEPSSTSPRWPTACAIGLGVAVVLLASSGPLPMVWDEGIYLQRADRTAEWFGKLLSGDLAMLGEPAIATHWPCTTREEGHPALYLWLMATGKALAGNFLSPQVAGRLGNVLLAGIAAGAVFWRLQRGHGDWVARCAVVALLAQPRLFAHLHDATLDGPLTCLWLLAWATFAPAQQTRRGAIGWGMVLGLLLSAKFTGWLAPLGFVIWAVVYRDRTARRAIGIGLPVALVAFFLLNPPLWHHPLAGPWEFLRLNLTRASEPQLNITTWFLGRLYDSNYSLPWYNTLLWTLIAVPVGVLLLAGYGLTPAVAALVKKKLPEAGLALVAIHWLLLIVVRALPGTPPHDGIRLFLPAFGFLAVLAGMGAGELKRWLEDRLQTCPTWTFQAVPIALLLGSLTSVFWYAPQQLSYYNLLCGGLRGATAIGMEPAYYWDGLDGEVLAWLDEYTAAGKTVRFAAGPAQNLDLLAKQGAFHFQRTDDDTFHWYVIQNRPGAFSPVDRWLVASATPAFAKTIRPRRSAFGPWRLDVPVVFVFDRVQYQRALEATRD